MVDNIMTDKQYEGMLKDSIAMLDRIAKQFNSKDDMLKAIHEERVLLESKLGYEINEHNLYDSIKE